MSILRNRITILEIGITYVSLVSIVNVLLLAFDAFSPISSLCISLFLLVVLYLSFKPKIELKESRFSILLFLILLIAITLRISPNLYLTGGQDQGSYVSMSKQYEINGGLDIEDKFRETLSEEERDLYDKYNVYTGVELKDLGKSEYVMPFYPVFPSWMSIFGNIFGSDNRIYSLTFFSVFSVLAIYLFAYEISNRKKSVGILASFFIAISPLHMYFSRVPLAETMVLMFLFLGFYYLLKFYNDYKEGSIQKISLLISLLIFSALFLTKMSGIFLLPIILLLPILLKIFSKDRKLLKLFTIYSLVWVFLLSLSYVFYKVFIPALFEQIIGKRIIEVFGSEFILIILISFIFIYLSFFLLKKVVLIKEIFTYLYKNISTIALIVFLLLILYQLYSYITEVFISNSYALLSKESLSEFKQMSFLIPFLYLSPVGFLLIPIFYITNKKKVTSELAIVIFGILIFQIYTWGILKSAMYHYYFTRYQLSELMPLFTILISIFLVYLYSKKRILAIVLIGFISVYSLFFSIIQYQSYEGMKKDSMNELVNTVGKDEVLFVLQKGEQSFTQIFLPLKYYYSLKIFPVRDIEDLYDLGKSDILFISSMDDLESDSVKLVKNITFNNNYFVHCLRNEDKYFKMESHSKDLPFCEYMIIPNRYYFGEYIMYLYRLEESYE